MGRKGKSRKWVQVDIDWGLDLARHMGVGGGDDEDEDDDGHAAELRVEFFEELEALIPANAAPGDIIPGAGEEDFAPVRQAVETWRQMIAGAELNQLLRLYNDPLASVHAALDEVERIVARREEARRALAGQARAVQTPEGAEQTEIEAIDRARDEVLRLLETEPFTQLALDSAGQAFLTLGEVVKGVLTEIDRRREERDRLRDEASQITEAGYLPDQRQALDTARETLARLLEDPVTAERLREAGDALTELRRIAQEITEDIQELGGTDEIDALCRTAGLPPEEFPAFEQHFGGRRALARVMKTFPAAELGGLCTGFGGKENGARALGQLVAAYGDPAAVKTTMTNIGGAPRMAALMTRGPLDGAGAKDACDALGARFLGALMQPGDDPAAAIALRGQFAGKEAALSALTADGGFATKPQALVGLLRTGCGGDGAAFVTLCESFGDANDRAALKGVVEDGGLGDAPDALGELFATGCGGRPDALKKFGAAFNDAPKRAGLARMLTTAGLAGTPAPRGPGDVDPQCLALLLQHGAGAPAGGDEDTRRATRLAALCAGLDAPACTNLGAVLGAGGLGAEPEVFGKLVGTGLGAGDPVRVAALAAELNGDPGRLVKFDKLLKTGGFGAADDTGAATNIDTECLAKLFSPGCEGNPAELTRLLGALGDTDFTNLKGLMVDGDLGQHPEVLAGLYKNGCINAPDGASNGPKNPQVLKAMMGEFAPPGGPAEFQDLLVNGGFSGANNEHRLGSMMRYAFAPPGGVQDGRKLKTLYTEFNGHMADLDTMMGAMDGAPATVLEPSAPGEPNQPGKALRNVANAPGHGGNVNQLRTKFFDRLNGRMGAGPPPGGVPANLGLGDLLANAASFEHAAVPVPVVAMGGTRDFDISHAAGRHTRKFNTLAGGGYNPNAPTTLYPRTVDGPGLQALCATAIGNIGPGTPRNAAGYGPNVGKPNPPAVWADLNHHHTHPTGRFTRFGGINDGAGRTARVGFDRGHPHPRVKVTQFFPEAGPDLVSINCDDMTAIRQALR